MLKSLTQVKTFCLINPTKIWLNKACREIYYKFRNFMGTKDRRPQKEDDGRYRYLWSPILGLPPYLTRMLLLPGQNFVNHAIFFGFIGCHPMIPVAIRPNFIVRLCCMA